MFTINKQSDYGLIMLSLLLQSKKRISLSQLIIKTGLPQRFLAKIASRLVNSNILLSKEGRDGGYTLTKKIHSLNLYDFLTIFEGDVVTTCCGKGRECKYKTCCKHKKALSIILAQSITENLKKIRIIDII